MGGYQLIGLFIGPYLDFLLFTVRPLRRYIDLENFDSNPEFPIPKTSGTRRHLLRGLPKLSRVAHHSELCFVFGLTELAFVCTLFCHPNGSTVSIRDICELFAHQVHSSSVVTIYNGFLLLSICFVQFISLHNG